MTEVVARDLKDQYRFLGNVDEMVGLTGIEIQYDKLESTVHRRGTKTFGTLSMNKSKNRYANIDMIPCEYCYALIFTCSNNNDMRLYGSCIYYLVSHINF